MARIVIPVKGALSFDDLLQRIHPAASRVKLLSEQTPSVFIVFDLLLDADGTNLTKLPLKERRAHLEKFAKKYFKKGGDLELSPATGDFEQARAWFHMGTSIDGIVAKRIDMPYQSGNRNGMEKIKTAAHRGLRCGRLPVFGKKETDRFVASRPLQQRRNT